jgi:hypothetical protein
MRLLFLDADGSEQERLVLEFAIHADIYSPVTRGQVRENARLAALNAPRLSEFLRNVREGTGGTISQIDAAYYPGLVNDHGFIGVASAAP